MNESLLDVNKWQRLKVPPICERMIGFSIPLDDEVLVISYEGVHLLQLGNKITVKTDNRFSEYDLYDPDSGTAQYQGKSYQIIGLHGGNPIRETPDGAKLKLDKVSETLSIIQGNQIDFSMKYTNFSGDWVSATFSVDGRYVVLGCPYDFDFVVLARF
jgi:hypothetical protein